jgi:hypothetical protein
MTSGLEKGRTRQPTAMLTRLEMNVIDQVWRSFWPSTEGRHWDRRSTTLYLSWPNLVQPNSLSC